MGSRTLAAGPLHCPVGLVAPGLHHQSQRLRPLVVTINAIPSQGLLGQLLCGLAGGTGINSLSGLQSLLSSLGLNKSATQIQNILNSLGITNLASGLSQSDINGILQALGFGSTAPAGG